MSTNRYGAVRIPDHLTFYVSQGDNALEFSRRMFRGRQRAGELLDENPVNAAQNEFIREHPQLRIIDVTDAEGGTLSGGHSYFRTSPWVSSDLLMTLLYDLAPEERGLVRPDDSPFWTFPPAYPDRLSEAVRATQSSESESQ